ncbi:MAG: endonuclease III domain-containing protein [Candidatus Aenigmarchaeota archaeon]|nr:endonuclease III domain-containing protein [Candidatus Aenigmarchaeota archaeon]
MERRKQLSDIYRTLFDKYKAQGWWPIITEQNKAIGKEKWICKYGLDTPNNEEEAFEIAVGAILTQNTSWKNVEKALINLKSSENISTEKVSRMPIEELENLIKPSGFYKQKALRLKEFSKFVASFGSMKTFTEKITRKELLKQKGIGPETCDSILLYACRKKEFIIDAYTKRIFSRIGLLEKDVSYEVAKKFFEENTPRDLEIYNEYHALIVEHAKQFCNKKPICEKCPLNNLCKKII